MIDGRGMVWVLEDSPLEAEMARRALAPSQDVVLFSDGNVLLERIATSSPPDVLVLDGELPGVTGVEVCRVVRETYAAVTLPILMLTVQEAKQAVIDALHAGANDYVTKPYHVAELVARVGTLVSSSRLMASQAMRTRQLALGAEIGAALTESRGLAETSRRSADAIGSRLKSTAVEVWTQSQADGLVRRATYGSADSAVARERIERVAALREPIAEDRFVGVPLIVRDELLGVLGAAARDRESADELEISLRGIASLVALGLYRSRAEEERIVLLDRERNARAESEAANRSKDEFLAMVSHELRTPLNAITGWTSMLISGGLDEARTRRAYETIDRNARSQAQLIDDLLDIGRITSGNLRLTTSSVEIASVAEVALESVRLSADARSLTLDAAFDPNAGTIEGDAARLQQVVWNLLSNAIKFTPKGGNISLSVAREPRGIVIAVRDTGQGISAEFLPRVFDRFKQADPSSTRARGGLGLGLAIVRHLVELHGGTIEARSDGVGAGSTFTVVLPTDPRTRVESDVLRGDRGILDRPREIEGLRVLVVDDEPDARELLRTLLESCKVEVTTASSAAEAMEAVTRTRVDIVLSDIAMPGEDGLSLIKRVRALGRDEGGRVPAVAITAYARLEDRTRALRAGFNAHVAKPVDPNELFAVLTSLAPAR